MQALTIHTLVSLCHRVPSESPRQFCACCLIKQVKSVFLRQSPGDDGEPGAEQEPEHAAAEQARQEGGSLALPGKGRNRALHIDCLIPLETPVLSLSHVVV